MTDRIHVEDLTQNHTPLGLLDDDTQARLKAWPHGVDVLGVYGEWVKCEPVFWHNTSTYRAITAPLEKPSVDWSHVGPVINHFAEDKDGRVCAFDDKPYVVGDCWNSRNGFIADGIDLVLASYRRGTVPWDQSLISRPGVKE